MFFKIAQKVTKYLGTLQGIFVTNNSQKSPNLVTLLMTSVENKPYLC